MKFLPEKSLLFFLLLLLPPGLTGQDPLDNCLEKVVGFDEIANREITSIIQDSNGFLWMGTFFGILKFDGYEVLSYKPDYYNPSSLQARKIRQLLQLGDTIWIGSIEKGLCYYDCITESFHEMPDQSIRGPSDNQVMALENDVFGNIWAGTSQGLFRVWKGNPDKISAVDLIIPPGKDSSKYNSAPAIIYDLTFDSLGNLWIGTGNGIYFIHHESLSKESGLTALPLIIPSQENEQASDKLFTCLECVNSGDNVSIWAGTMNGILNFVVPHSSLDKKTITQVAGTESVSRNIQRVLANKAITAIEGDSNSGDLWIGTLENLYKLDPVSSRIRGIIDCSENQKLRISSIYQDHNNTVWIGTMGGLYRVDNEKKMFRMLTEDLKGGGPIYLSSLIELENEYLAATFGRGLFIISKGEDGAPGRMIPLENIRQERKNLLQDIRCSIKDSRGYAWIGTKGRGLIRFKIKDGTISEWMHFDPEKPGSNFPDEIMSLKEHPDGSILVGSYSHGLLMLNPETEEVLRIERFSSTAQHEKDFPVTDILVESNEVIWLATRGSGLYKILLRGGGEYEYKRFPANKSNINSLCDNYINEICVDHLGGIWLATEDGLSLFDRRSQSFRNFYEHNGLSDNCIQSIIEDAEGFIWASSINGLNRIDPATLLDSLGNNAVDVFTREDGLANNYFINKSTFPLGDRFLITGNLDGITYFNPTAIEPNYSSSDPIIKALYLKDKKIRTGEKINGRVILEKNLQYQDRVDLKAKETDITIDFSAPMLDHPSRTRYAYRLKEHNNTWNYIMAPNLKVNFLNLPPGDHTFEVKVSNPDGSWNPNLAVLMINRALPLWRTPQAFILYILLLSGILLLFRRIVSQRLELLNKIKLESYEREKKEELYQHKLRFFTNISHEIKTPLSLILGPVKSALNSQDPEEKTYTLKLVQRNANRLLNLVNQLLEFRKVETDNLSLRVSYGNISELTQKIVEDFRFYAREKNIQLDLYLENEQLEGYFDEDKYEKILYNLLSNAIKYTDSNRSIFVKVNTEYDPDREIRYLICRVEDTGKGIPPDKLHKIFERYYRAEQNDQGIGIGLALSKKLVEVHKGSITVKSEMDKGTAFQFILPIDQYMYKEQEFVERSPAKDIPLPFLQDETLKVPPLRKQDPLSPEKLLIIEDDPELRQFLRHTFCAIYPVFTAEDGEEGYQKTTKEKPDIIIADFMMPSMSGLELYEKLKQNHSTENIPFILLTAHLDEQLEKEISNAGVDLVLKKPFDPDLLKIQVKNLLGKQIKIKTHVEKEFLLKNTGNKSPDKKKDNLETRVLKIIDQHSSRESFNIDFLAQEMGMSRMKLYRNIKNHFKMSPVELIRKVRLSKVAASLKEKDANISEVAFQNGFNDMKYFRECFKKEFGKTPSEYIRTM